METQILNGQQRKQFDKIFKENMEGSFPGIMKHALGIVPALSEELPDSIQHTKEREPDVLKKVIDQRGNTFVLQVEFQVKGDLEMAYRMAEYYIMLARKHKLPIRQYVVFVGAGRTSMPTRLELGRLSFEYPLVLTLSITTPSCFPKSQRKRFWRCLQHIQRQKAGKSWNVSWRA